MQIDTYLSRLFLSQQQLYTCNIARRNYKSKIKKLSSSLLQSEPHPAADLSTSTTRIASVLLLLYTSRILPL